jgi:hypothetical protein
MIFLLYGIIGMFAGNMCLPVGNVKPTYDSDEEAFLMKAVIPVYKGTQYDIIIFKSLC